MKKIKKFKILFFISIFVNYNVCMVEASEVCKIYYLDIYDNDKLVFKEYIFLEKFMLDIKIKEVLDEVIKDRETIKYIPDGTSILNTYLLSNNLFINFSNEIENYGGTYYENNMIRQFLHTIFQYEGINTVTFMIDGKFKTLPEGSTVFKYTRDYLKLLDENQKLP